MDFLIRRISDMLTMRTMKITPFWDAMQCSSVQPGIATQKTVSNLHCHYRDILEFRLLSAHLHKLISPMNIGKIHVNDKFTILEVKVYGENKIW
jgi:hypothetical protein